METKPIHYSRSPYSKKWIWFDARSLTPLVHITFDRRGQMFKQWEGGFDIYSRPGGPAFMEPTGHPMWSWVHVHSHDIQTDNISLLQLHKELPGGYKTAMNAPGLYETYCTLPAIQQLGA